MYLVAGLGNPGTQYEGTLHNAGFMATDLLAARWRRADAWQKRFQGNYLEGQVRGEPVAIVQPLTFMNLSGKSVADAVRQSCVALDHLIVLYDDVDIPPGAIRIRKGGSSGGHKGLGSIIAELGSDGFIRVRIGVGRCARRGDTADYVLSTPATAEESAALAAATQAAAEAVDLIIRRGLTLAMNTYNNKNLLPAPQGDPDATGPANTPK